MARKIYTYTDIRRLPECSFFHDIQSIPQITVSIDMRKGLEQDLRYRAKIIDFNQLIKTIAPRWTTPDTKFKEIVAATELIRNKVENTDSQEERDWLLGCRRNLSQILSGIVLLEEAKVDIGKLDRSDKNIDLFIRIWQYLQKKTPIIRKFRHDMDKLQTEQGLFTACSYLFPNKRAKKSVIFHGFYSITPIQRRVMEAFENQGFDILFLFQYNQRYPYANEIWDTTYSVENGFPDKSEWIMDSSEDYSLFGEIMEGNPYQTSSEIRIKEYTNTLEFVDDIKRVKDRGFEVYSANYDAANNILKDYYPEEYGNRKLLSYPVGQFVSLLNQMWGEQEGEVILSDDLLRRCFASGWLSEKGTSSKAYMQDLEEILPFFQNCHRVDEWNERIQFLSDIHNYVIAPFRAGESKATAVEKRWMEVYGNPFTNFSMFAVPPERMTAVLNLINRLIEMAEKLFAEEKETSISEHLRKLNDILQEQELNVHLYKEEIEVVHELLSRLEGPLQEEMTCFPSDMVSALSLFLDGSLEDEEIRNTGKGMVTHMTQMDAAGLKCNGKIHICYCDVTSMPGKNSDFVWPLTEKLIIGTMQETGNRYLKNIMDVMNTASLFNRYCMYLALKNNDVELSWISNVNGKKMAPSPYILLISDFADVPVEQKKKKRITSEYIEKQEIAARKTAQYIIHDAKNHIAEEAQMDYALCPMKYVLGYILDAYPAYQSVFLHNYAINGLIYAIYKLVADKGVSLEQIEEQVIELFPNLRTAEKRQIRDYLSAEKNSKEELFEGTTEYKDYAYTNQRLRLKFLTPRVRRRAQDLYGKLYTADRRENLNPYEATDVEEVCVFCQHQSYCRNAVFSQDQEDYYE